MLLHPLKSTAGFTYIAALAIVMIMGIMMGVAGQSWKMIMAREREAELLWVGTQYRNAIRKWEKPGGGHPRTRLNDLKDLLKDPRSLQNIRYLRKLYPDPITGKEFVTIPDPTGVWGIIGVKSTSEKEPIKQKNFPDEFVLFEDKKKYAEWEFTDREPPKKAISGGVSGIPTTTLPTKSGP